MGIEKRKKKSKKYPFVFYIYLLVFFLHSALSLSVFFFSVYLFCLFENLSFCFSIPFEVLVCTCHFTTNACYVDHRILFMSSDLRASFHHVLAGFLLLTLCFFHTKQKTHTKMINIED